MHWGSCRNAVRVGSWSANLPRRGNHCGSFHEWSGVSEWNRSYLFIAAVISLCTSSDYISQHPSRGRPRRTVILSMAVCRTIVTFLENYKRCSYRPHYPRKQPAGSPRPDVRVGQTPAEIYVALIVSLPQAEKIHVALIVSLPKFPQPNFSIIEDSFCVVEQKPVITSCWTGSFKHALVRGWSWSFSNESSASF